MQEYKLEIKQIVDYPRCRIYRGFVQNLIADRSIRTNGCSGLFHYVVLCSYANFRTSYRRVDGISYAVYPGSWICRLQELMGALRLRSKRQVVSVLDQLQMRGLIRYSVLGRGTVVRYSIVGWDRFNTILEYNCPCQKESGFFFIPYATAMELVSFGKCSEMDSLLDLWISAVYNDSRVQGSMQGPVVYLRNGTGCPLVSYAELAERWGISKATVCRTLKKFCGLGHITLLSFPGRHGSAIYLQNYLSVMFEIADVMIDKAEVAMCLNIRMATENADQPRDAGPERSTDSVAKEEIIVSDRSERLFVRKVLKLLEFQGVSCPGCGRCGYKLYPLSDDCKGKIDAGILKRCRLDVYCTGLAAAYAFELTISRA